MLERPAVPEASSYPFVLAILSKVPRTRPARSARSVASTTNWLHRVGIHETRRASSAAVPRQSVTKVTRRVGLEQQGELRLARQIGSVRVSRIAFVCREPDTASRPRRPPDELPRNSDLRGNAERAVTLLSTATRVTCARMRFDHDHAWPGEWDSSLRPSAWSCATGLPAPTSLRESELYIAVYVPDVTPVVISSLITMPRVRGGFNCPAECLDV